MESIVAELDAATGGLAVDADGNLYHADFGARSDVHQPQRAKDRERPGVDPTNPESLLTAAELDVYDR